MAKKINKTPEQTVITESYVEQYAREHKLGKYRETETVGKVDKVDNAEQTTDVEGEADE